MTSLSPSRMAAPTAAAMTSICWRFLIGIAASFPPVEIERELQRRLAPDVVHFKIAHVLGRAQLVEHLEQRLVVARHAGAGHGGYVTDLQRLGRHHAVLGKGLGDLA